MTKYIVTLSAGEFKIRNFARTAHMTASEVYDAVMYPDNDAEAIAAFDTEAEANAFGAKLIEDGKVFTDDGYFHAGASFFSKAAVAHVNLVEFDEDDVDDLTDAEDIFLSAYDYKDGDIFAVEWSKESPAALSELVEFYHDFTCGDAAKRDRCLRTGVYLNIASADELAAFITSNDVTEDFLALIVRDLDLRDWDEDFGWKLTDSVRIRDIEEQDEDGEYVHIRYEID